MTTFRKGDHMGMAREWLRGREIVRWDRTWVRWDIPTSAYTRVSDSAMEAEAWKWLDRQHGADGWLVGTDGGEPTPSVRVPILPNRNRVANLIKAARAQRYVPTPPGHVSNDYDSLSRVVVARRETVLEALKNLLIHSDDAYGLYRILHEVGGVAWPEEPVGRGDDGKRALMALTGIDPARFQAVIEACEAAHVGSWRQADAVL